ncbi:GOLPH3/VPS74 family protein [Microbacterium sp. CPCC 204701]|uniref:GOLPH3/VPS74 family protein n=1 Tax=Microbacterium sp. CPCC 204701 TaxID=2493084 RepID=UPI000FD8A9B0|nr:GPP34 family phosphoprotein [Microbacterium sp. CPCC 204701]
MSNHDPSQYAEDPASIAAKPTPATEGPLLAEDLMLMLFQPDSGTISGENTLFYVLAASALAELAQRGEVGVDESGIASVVVRADATPPADDLLRGAWDYIAKKPRDVQTVLAAVGPSLRQPVLDRLVARGDIRRQHHKMLGFIPSTALAPGSARRGELIAAARAVLVDRAEPDPRTAALIALISASGAMPTLHREIPWTTPVITRAKQFERGEWGAEAAAAAVTRTMTAVITNAIVAAVVLPRS